nr:MAG TPA: hypothetical protein [Caudoviricetes sp.]
MNITVRVESLGGTPNIMYLVSEPNTPYGV